VEEDGETRISTSRRMKDVLVKGKMPDEECKIVKPVRA